jgi:hypothetical protein
VSDVERIAQPVDLQKTRDAEIDFGLGHSDGTAVLMLIGPMSDEIRYLRAALDEANTDLRQLRDIQERLVTRELFDEVLAERDMANQNLRTLEKTVANLESGLRYEQAARERVQALCDRTFTGGGQPLEGWVNLASLLSALRGPALAGEGSDDGA